jgi:hypothetical protein
MIEKQLLTSSVAAHPPRDSPSLYDVRTVLWVSKRFTPPEWEINAIEFEKNTHLGESAPTVLELSASHSSGSILQCRPFDPMEHSHETPQYSEHRLRVRNANSGEQFYLTPKVDFEGCEDLINKFRGITAHPLPNLNEKFRMWPQEKIHRKDAEAMESERREATIPSIRSALLGVIAGTQQISKKLEQQTSLSAFGKST